MSGIRVALSGAAGRMGRVVLPGLEGTPGIEGSRVVQVFAGGLLGSIYRVKCKATTLVGNVFALSADVPVNTVFGV